MNRNKEEKETDGLDRRSFITKTLVAGAGLGGAISFKSTELSKEKPRVTAKTGAAADDRP